MKRLLSFLIILIIILGVVLIGAYLVLRNEMRPEKIAERVEDISSTFGYDISFSNIDYSLSLNGINAAISDVNIEGQELALLSGKINFNLDILRFLFKEIVIRNMTVYNGIFIIKDFSSDSVAGDTSAGQHYMLSSDIFLRNCSIIYDSINIDSLNGSLTISADRAVSVTGNVKFMTNVAYLRHMGYIESGFALISGKKQQLIIRNLSIGDIAAFYGNMTLRDDTLLYSINGKIIAPDTLLGLFDIPVEMNGNIECAAEGIICFNDSLNGHLANISTFEASTNDMSVKYEDLDLTMADGNSFAKQDSMLIVSSGIYYMDRLFSVGLQADYLKLIKGTVNATFECDDADLSIINEFTDELSVSGYADINGSGEIQLDSTGNVHYIINAINGNLLSEHMQIRAETLNISINNIRVIKQGDIANIDASSDYRGFETHMKGTVNIPDSVINAYLSTRGNIASLVPDYWGECIVEGQGKYAVKDKQIKANTTFSILNASGTGLTDTFNIIGENVSLSGTERIDTKNINITGKYISANISSMSFLFDSNPVIDLKAGISYINIDSLFPITDSVLQTESTKPRIPDDLEIYFSAGCDEAVFRGEQIRTIDLTGRLFRDSLIIDSFRGNAIKGEARGNVLYMPETGFIHIDTWVDDINLNDFLSRHPVSPYDMGGNIDAHSDMTLYQDSMSKTISGTVQTEISGGYMLSPDVLKNISNVIRYPISDTFFFDNMYGEFDIADEIVSFDDFIMEKHGHNLIYSGNVDFRKRIFVDGKYTIDMKIADTGMFETLLRNTGYKADTVGVQFELLGNYKNPAVNIKKNSIGEYLKNSTQQVVDDFINNLNNIFKF